MASCPRTGLPPLSEESVAAVLQPFLRSPAQSTRRASRELGIPPDITPLDFSCGVMARTECMLHVYLIWTY